MELWSLRFVIISGYLCVSTKVSGQGLHVTYQEYLAPPPGLSQSSSDNNREDFTKAGFYHLWIDDETTVCYSSTTSESDFGGQAEMLKGIVYYTDLSADRLTRYDHTYLDEYYSILSAHDWTILDSAELYQGYSVYSATNQKGNKVHYVPDIPIVAGPKEYRGLPGLIVRVETGDRLIELYTLEQSADFLISSPDWSGLTEIDEKKFAAMRIEALLKKRSKQ